MKKDVKKHTANAPGSFNLLDEPWIPALYRDGNFKNVGIKRALAEAAEIREIHAASPLDTVSVYRFLLAVTLWCGSKVDGVDFEEIRGKGRFPKRFFEQLDRAPFDIFDAREPLYQDLTVSAQKKNSSITLLQELPKGSNIAHFRHSRDFRDGLCENCCTLGLIRTAAYAAAGKKGRDA